VIAQKPHIQEMTMKSSDGDMQFLKGDPAELAQQNYDMAQKRSREAEQHFDGSPLGASG
jgi:hypothetical protein